jgi:hypothetical protein
VIVCRAASEREIRELVEWKIRFSAERLGRALIRRRLRQLEVSAIGLGRMGMSAFCGSTDEDEGVRTIQCA